MFFPSFSIKYVCIYKYVLVCVVFSLNTKSLYIVGCFEKMRTRNIILCNLFLFPSLKAFLACKRGFCSFLLQYCFLCLFLLYSGLTLISTLMYFHLINFVLNLKLSLILVDNFLVDTVLAGSTGRQTSLVKWDKTIDAQSNQKTFFNATNHEVFVCRKNRKKF